MSSYRPPKGTPKTELHLGQLVRAYADTSGLAPGRVRQRISAMALLGALERAREVDSPTRFLLKGGMACELRFPGKARTTKDLDVIFHGSLDQLLADLDTAFAEPYSGFAFRYSEPRAIRETAAHRFEVKLQYRGRSWGTLRVEASAPEGDAHEAEMLPALSLDAFGLIGPVTVACLSLRYQVAQKLHACSERFHDRENERAHDLIDLLLMQELILDYATVKDACVAVFALRNRHGWPPALTAEAGWYEQYPPLAAELDFPITDLDQAIAAVHDLVAAIDAAKRIG